MNISLYNEDHLTLTHRYVSASYFYLSHHVTFTAVSLTATISLSMSRTHVSYILGWNVHLYINTPIDTYKDIDDSGKTELAKVNASQVTTS